MSGEDTWIEDQDYHATRERLKKRFQAEYRRSMEWRDEHLVFTDDKTRVPYCPAIKKRYPPKDEKPRYNLRTTQ